MRNNLRVVYEIALSRQSPSLEDGTISFLRTFSKTLRQWDRFQIQAGGKAQEENNEDARLQIDRERFGKTRGCGDGRNSGELQKGRPNQNLARRQPADPGHSNLSTG